MNTFVDWSSIVGAAVGAAGLGVSVFVAWYQVPKATKAAEEAREEAARVGTALDVETLLLLAEGLPETVANSSSDLAATRVAQLHTGLARLKARIGTRHPRFAAELQGQLTHLALLERGLREGSTPSASSLEGLVPLLAEIAERLQSSIGSQP